MGHLTINCGDTLPVDALRRGLEALTPGAPVILMIHGFRYCPDDPANNPHRLILSDQPVNACWKAVSWPSSLDLAPGDGLTIGIGWSARRTIWQAYHGAQTAARNVAGIVAGIRAMAPTRPIHLIGHSLGARVALQCLAHLDAPDVNRMVLISPAEFQSEARAAMATPAGQRAEVFTMLSAQNTAFDLLLRTAMPHKGATLGRGGAISDTWLDVRLDNRATLDALSGLGFEIGADGRKVCHWAGYLRPGIWQFYRAVMTRPEQTPIAFLSEHITPRPSAPGWGWRRA